MGSSFIECGLYAVYEIGSDRIGSWLASFSFHDSRRKSFRSEILYFILSISILFSSFWNLTVVTNEPISSFCSSFLEEFSGELLTSISGKLFYSAVLDEIDEVDESNGGANIGIQIFPDIC